MTHVTLIGLAAAACTTFAYVPQVVQSWRTGHTKDISFTMFALMSAGVLLWLIYGILLRDLALVLANGITLLLSSTLLVLKLRNG